MAQISRQRFETAADWEAAWTRPVRVSRLVRDIAALGSRSSQERFVAGTNFLAGALYGRGYGLLDDETRPQYVRNQNPLREEILLRKGPYSVRGYHVPVTLEFRIADDRLAQLRAGYWPAICSPSSTLIRGNLGELQTLATFDIWNLAANTVFDELSEFLGGEVARKLDVFQHRVQLRECIFTHQLPMLDPLTGLEWLLIEFGKRDAREYLKIELARLDHPWGEFEALSQVMSDAGGALLSSGKTIHNMAVFASNQQLTRRYLI